jgi:hypothetical protein
MISDWNRLPHHIVLDGSVETFKAAVSILSQILIFRRFNWHTLQLVEYDHYLVEVDEDGVGIFMTITPLKQTNNNYSLPYCVNSVDLDLFISCRIGLWSIGVVVVVIVW